MRPVTPDKPELLDYEWCQEDGVAVLVYLDPGALDTREERRVQRRWWLTPEEREKLHP